MPNFSRSSLNKLNTCHPDLIRLMNEVIKDYDITVIYGRRTNEEQAILFKEGKSKLGAGKSKHNKTPSLAIDVVPYFNSKPHIDWSHKAIPDFAYMCGFIAATALDLGIKIRLGCKWDKFNIRSNSYKDYAHIELL